MAGKRNDRNYGDKRNDSGHSRKRADKSYSVRGEDPSGGRENDRSYGERRDGRRRGGREDVRTSGRREDGRHYEGRKDDRSSMDRKSIQQSDRNRDDRNIPIADDMEDNEAPGRLEGKNTILEALKANHPMNRLYLEKDSKDPVIGRIFAIARKQDIVVSFVEKGKLDRMSRTRNHQGVIADVSPHAYVQVEDILKRAREKNEPLLLLILDGITDPNNLGSMIRTAECAGVHGIILPKRRSAGMSPVVAKVAAGAAEHIPIARVTNLTRTIQDLKNSGVWIIGTDIQGDTSYDAYDYQGPMAVVIGSEGEGISRLVRDNCDVLLRIPMYGKINSLNAAVACGLIVFQAAAKRRGSAG